MEEVKQEQVSNGETAQVSQENTQTSTEIVQESNSETNGVEHVITPEDLEENPELKGEVEVGETVVLPPLNEVVEPTVASLGGVSETMKGSPEAELVEKLDKMADVVLENLPEAPANSKEFIQNGKRYRKYLKEDGSSGPCWLLDENGLEVEKVS